MYSRVNLSNADRALFILCKLCVGIPCAKHIGYLKKTMVKKSLHVVDKYDCAIRLLNLIHNNLTTSVCMCTYFYYIAYIYFVIIK